MFRQRSIISKSSFEVLPNNRLDKDIQRVAYSFNFVFNLFFTSKYCIRDNHIYPNGKVCHFLSVCHLLVSSALCLYQMTQVIPALCNTTNMDIVGIRFTMLVLLFFSSSYIICFTTMFILDLVHKHNYVFLILELQTIHKSVDFSENIRSYIIWNWISMSATICSEFVFLYFLFDSSIVNFICHVMFIEFDVSSVLTIRVIILLRLYLDKWIKDVLVMNDDQENEERCVKLLEIYQNILKAFDLSKQIFQVLVLYQVLEAFLRSLGLFEIILFILKLVERAEESVPMEEMLLFGLPVILKATRCIVFPIIHSINCEKFYISVEEAETACMQLMANRDCPKSQKHLCKNVFQTNRTYSKMTACGVLDVGGTLPMYLIGVITHYAIVQLQFFFL